MASYRVTVTYTVDVVDTEALLSAGRAAWSKEPASWVMAYDEHGAVEVEVGVADEVEPTPEASIAWVLDEHRFPAVPGVRFSAMGVNAVPVSADEVDDLEGGDSPPCP